MNTTRRIAALCLCLGLGFSVFASNEAQAQLINRSLPACDAACIPSAAMCQAAHAMVNGAAYVDSPSTPPTCPVDCLPSTDQCQHTLAVCPSTRFLCGETPRSPTRHTPRPADICVAEANAELDPDHPGTCRCTNDGASPAFIGQVRRYRRGQWRMRVVDSTGATHIGCFGGEFSQTTPPPPTATPFTPPTVTPTTPPPSGPSREEIERIVRESVDAANVEQDRKIAELQSHARVRPGIFLAGALHVLNLPTELSMDPMFYPAGGASLRFDWPTGTHFTLQLFGAVGGVDTGHACSAVTVDAGVRFGWSIGESRVVTPHLGWSGFWANAPCAAPPGGREVTDGVAFASGPTLGLTVRLWDGLHLGGEIGWTPFSRFTKTTAEDSHGSIPLSAMGWIGYDFF